jgi:heat shock protein HslJ
MKKIKLFEVIAVLVMLCSTAFAGISCAKNNDNKLESVTWELKSYGDPNNLTKVMPDGVVALTFVKEKKEISGNGGVNGYGGNYTVNGDKLTVSGIIQTMMASTNKALNNQENTYFKILASAKSFKIDGGQLTITGTEGTLVFLQK